MKLLKQPSVYIGLSILAILIAAYFLTLIPKPEDREVVTVARGDIIEEVFITGTVRAARKVSLSFDRSGTIQSLPFPVGTIANAGAIIASLQNGSEYASLAEGTALVAIAEANLANIRQGTREEEILLKEAEVHKVEVSLRNGESRIASTLADAYTAAEESLNRYAAPFFANDDTITPRLTYSSGTQEAYNAAEQRLRAGQSVVALQKAAQGSLASVQTLEEAARHLRAVQDLFITLGLTLRDGSALDAALLTDYRSRVTSARSALATALAAVENRANELRDGAAELLRAKQALSLARAKATPETLAKAEQELAQAKARLRGAEALLEKTLLRAPFRGTISSKNVEVGETIQAGKLVMDFLGTDGFTIEASVPEADVAKLEKGAGAEVTLDAYGERLVFLARVTLIEPASTEIDGVPTYKTTFSFETQDQRFRSGMTANITLKKRSKINVLIVPSRAVRAEDGKRTVQKLSPDGTVEDTYVQTGLQSGSRDVEIVEGLNEGDRIVIPAAK